MKTLDNFFGAISGENFKKNAVEIMKKTDRSVEEIKKTMKFFEDYDRIMDIVKNYPFKKLKIYYAPGRWKRG